MDILDSSQFWHWFFALFWLISRWACGVILFVNGKKALIGLFSLWLSGVSAAVPGRTAAHEVHG